MKLHCDLNLVLNNQDFTQNTLEYHDLLSNDTWLQKDQTSPKVMVKTVKPDYEP